MIFAGARDKDMGAYRNSSAGSIIGSKLSTGSKMGSEGIDGEEESGKTTYDVEIGSTADKYLKECRTYVRFEAGLNRMTPLLCA